MKILFAASEALPFIASGGLADVAGSLPKAINDEYNECRVVIPLYKAIPDHMRNSLRYITDFTVPVSWRNQYCGLFEAENNGVKYYFIDNEYYFKRDGLYGHYDDAERFTFFSRAVLEMLKFIDFKPDIIHANDWQTALVPVYYKIYYQWLNKYQNIKTVFTIHNIQYQGKYGKEVLSEVLGIDHYHMNILEYDDCLNFMKGAIVTSDWVTTVSPSYAQELCHEYFAYSLDGIIKDNAHKIIGILNGIDVESYNPETDSHIFTNYNAADFSGKAGNKAGLQEMFGLPVDDSRLLVGMVTRLVDQKGIELVKFVLDETMCDNIQLVVVGKGDRFYENYFEDIQKKYADRLAVKIGFFQDIARKVYAGSDVFLMPSKTEPCGLAQMIALRYGTIPVVMETGGLKDSIRDCESCEGNGYTFKSFNAHDMLGAIRRAEGAFAQKTYWNKLVKRAISCDFGWEKSAEEYRKLYYQLSI